MNLFSICTLVTDFSQYETMTKSFRASGFNDDIASFQFIDNSASNVMDGYSGNNELISRSNSKYIILCHQDVEVIYDNADQLLSRLDELEGLDSSWGVAGNAGGMKGRKLAVRISDPQGKNTKLGSLPALVNTLDENFLVIKRSANLGFSRDLSGFHMYGPDLVMQAKLRGWNAYVIDFHLLHKSGGKKDETFYKCLSQFEEKYCSLQKPIELIRSPIESAIIIARSHALLRVFRILKAARQLLRWKSKS